jgi:hypothetical protein
MCKGTSSFPPITKCSVCKDLKEEIDDEEKKVGSSSSIMALPFVSFSDHQRPSQDRLHGWDWD